MGSCSVKQGHPFSLPQTFYNSLIGCLFAVVLKACLSQYAPAFLGACSMRRLHMGFMNIDLRALLHGASVQSRHAMLQQSAP